MGDAGKKHPYSVTGVRYHKGHEGMQGVNGRILREGREIGSFYDDARGGEWELQFGPGGAEEREAFYAYVKGLPPEPCSWAQTGSVAVSPDMFLGGLCDAYERTVGHESRLRRLCRTKTVFLPAGLRDEAGAEYRTLALPYSSAARERVLAKYPGATFVNDRFPQGAAEKRLAEAGIRVGDRVLWEAGERAIHGVVVRLNAKTLTLRADDGREWRCGLGGAVRKVPA